MSEEVALSRAPTVIDLQSQLAAAHEQLAIAESTVTLWRDAGTALVSAPSLAHRGVAWRTMQQLLREAEAGAGELRRLRQELEETRKERWECQSCGAEFPHINGDATTQRCSKCVEAGVLGRELERSQTQLIESERRAADARNDRNIMRQALDEIDRHVVGAYETDGGSVEPCEECGDMREIASQALALVKAVAK